MGGVGNDFVQSVKRGREERGWGCVCWGGRGVK